MFVLLQPRCVRCTAAVPSCRVHAATWVHHQPPPAQCACKDPVLGGGSACFRSRCWLGLWSCTLPCALCIYPLPPPAPLNHATSPHHTHTPRVDAFFLSWRVSPQVTLTRARNHLFVCGNRAALSQHTVWRAVIASAGTAPGGIRGTLSRPLLPDVPVRGRGGAHGSSGPTSEVDHEGFTVEDSLPSDIEDAED